MAVVKVWKPLSGQIVNSFGQGKCTFDCQSGNFKTTPLATMSEAYTFHTNSLLHGCLHVHK